MDELAESDAGDGFADEDGWDGEEGEDEEDGAAFSGLAAEGADDGGDEHHDDEGFDGLGERAEGGFLEDVAVEAEGFEDEGSEGDEDHHLPVEAVDFRDGEPTEPASGGGAQGVGEPEGECEEGTVDNLVELQVEFLFAAEHGSRSSRREAETPAAERENSP